MLTNIVLWQLFVPYVYLYKIYQHKKLTCENFVTQIFSNYGTRLLLEVFLWLMIHSLVYISTSACAKMVRNGPASPNYSAKAAAMCKRCHY